jgi:hypothetical protein
MAGLRRSPFAVAATVLVLLAAWVGWAHHIGHAWHTWADVGQHFVHSSSSSPAIDADARGSVSRFGYDGQFFLYIAQDPRGAVPYIDNPSYRYGRIAYPIAARALALGRQGAIPLALILLNVAGVVLGTWAVAAWLRRRGQSAWLALLFAAFPGVVFAVWRDLSEPLAYSLAAVAVVVFDASSSRRLAVSSALFAVAGLTRESVLIFAVVWAAALLVEGRRRAAALFAAAAVLPCVAYRFVFLEAWLGNAGLPAHNRPTAVPFGGIFHFFPWEGAELQRAYSVFLPGTVVLAVAAYALYRGAREPAVWALLANAVFFVVLLPTAAYEDIKSALRLSTGVVLALLLALPALGRVLPASRAWFWIPVVAWFAPWYWLLPALLDPSWD